MVYGYDSEDFEEGFHFDSESSEDYSDLEAIARDPFNYIYGAFDSSKQTFSPEELQSKFSMSSCRDDEGDLRIQFYLEGLNTGYATLSTFPGEIVWNHFYPMDNCLEMEGNGIGTLAHVETLNHLIDRGLIQENTYITHLNGAISDSRLEHFRALGVLDAIEEPMSFDDYLEKSVSYANSKGFDF